MPEMDNPDGLRELVIVSGMSGAGRTEAMHVFEDLGYFCVDNLPPALICKLVDMRDFPTAPDVDNRIAVVCDVRSREFFEGLSNAEIADIMRKSKRQIENILYRAKAALRSVLEKEGFEYEIV